MLSLRSNFTWSLVGNVVYAVCQWAVVTVLAQLGTPEMVGRFALALAVTAPVMQFASLQLRSVQATDASDQFGFEDYLTLRSIMTLCAFLFLMLLTLFGGYDSVTGSAILLVAMAKAVDSISDVFFGYFQRIGQMDLIAKALMINGLVSLSLLTIGIHLTDHLLAGVVGYLVGSLVTLFLFVFPIGRRMLFATSGSEISMLHWSGDTFRRLLLMSLPLGVVILLVSLNGNVPRLVIERVQGEEALGVYAALAYFIVAGNTVVGALGQAVSPRLARLFSAGRLDVFRLQVWRLIGVGLLIGVCGAGVAFLGGREIIETLYGEDFAVHSDVLILLSLGGGLVFGASFAGYGLTAARRFGVQVPMFVSVLLVSVASSLVLIPRYGLSGAALSVILSTATQLLVSLLVLNKTLTSKESTRA